MIKRACAEILSHKIYTLGLFFFFMAVFAVIKTLFDMFTSKENKFAMFFGGVLTVIFYGFLHFYNRVLFNMCKSSI